MTFLEAENSSPNHPSPKKYFWQRVLWKINKIFSGPPVPIAKHTPCHCGRFFCGEKDH
jgi:hypothetical protein